MRKKARENPIAICSDCGGTYGKKTNNSSKWNYGYCDMCGDRCLVTSVEHFNGLIESWKKDIE